MLYVNIFYIYIRNIFIKNKYIIYYILYTNFYNNFKLHTRSTNHLIKQFSKSIQLMQHTASIAYCYC